MSRVVFALSLAAGCGFHTPGASTDAGGDPHGPFDGPPDEMVLPPGRCLAKWMDGSVQLSNPTPMAALNSMAVDRDPFISADGLRLYFATERGATSDVYVATRASVADEFGAPNPAFDLVSSGYDSRVSLTNDDLIAVEASERLGGAGFSDLWIAARPSTSLGFTGFTRIPFGTTNDAEQQLDPEVNAQGTRVYFAYGFPQRLVYLSRPDVTSAFGPMTELLSGTGNCDPALSVDERLLLFGSNRPGGPGGDGDIWYTTRANATTTQFAAPALVPAVNGAGTDGDPSLSDDGCTLYFSSYRTGNWEIYVSTVN